VLYVTRRNGVDQDELELSRLLIHKPSSLCLRLDFMYSTMHTRAVSPY
jgi:hypothetical protein